MLKVKSHTPVDGVQVDVITRFGASYGIDFDREKNVYIPDFKTGNFIRLSSDLEQQQAFDTNGSALVDSTINQSKSVADAVKALDSPHEVSFDDDGNIYVSDYGAGCVAQIAAPEGTVLRRLGEKLNDGIGMIQPVTTHFARDGFLYVGEYGNARILRYTKEGEMMGWLGATEDGPAQFHFRTSGKPVALNAPGGLSYPHATRIDAVAHGTTAWQVDWDRHAVIQFMGSANVEGRPANPVVGWRWSTSPQNPKNIQKKL